MINDSIRNRYLLTIITIINLLYFCFQCGDNLEDPDPPSKVLWVEKTAPQDSIEHGIDAYDGDGIYLEWHRNFEDDLAGYKIYRAFTSPDSNFVKIMEVENIGIINADTSWIDELAPIDKYCYYYIRAFDHAGNVSERSDTIEYKLITKAELVSPTINDIPETTPVFKWNDYGRDSYQYVLYLENFLSKEVIWIYRMNKRNYGDFLQSVLYNSNGTAKVRELSKGQTYRWRIDAIGVVNPMDIDISGSESNWGFFSIAE